MMTSQTKLLLRFVWPNSIPKPLDCGQFISCRFFFPDIERLSCVYGCAGLFAAASWRLTGDLWMGTARHWGPQKVWKYYGQYPHFSSNVTKDLEAVAYCVFPLIDLHEIRWVGLKIKLTSCCFLAWRMPVGHSKKEKRQVNFILFYCLYVPARTKKQICKRMASITGFESCKYWPNEQIPFVGNEITGERAGLQKKIDDFFFFRESASAQRKIGSLRIHNAVLGLLGSTPAISPSTSLPSARPHKRRKTGNSSSASFSTAAPAAKNVAKKKAKSSDPPQIPFTLRRRLRKKEKEEEEEEEDGGNYYYHGARRHKKVKSEQQEASQREEREAQTKEGGKEETEEQKEKEDEAICGDGDGVATSKLKEGAVEKVDEERTRRKRTLYIPWMNGRQTNKQTNKRTDTHTHAHAFNHWPFLHPTHTHTHTAHIVHTTLTHCRFIVILLLLLLLRRGREQKKKDLVHLLTSSCSSLIRNNIN